MSKAIPFPHPHVLRLCLGVIFSVPAVGLAADANVGYSDTPMLPGQPWKVHDGTRPQPRVITPAASFSLGANAPSDAVVLFDGTDMSNWVGAEWKVENGYMEAVKGSPRSKQEFGDFQLHLEFATPAEVKGSSQGRGNSGVIIYGMYEIQVLDSYHNPTYPDGQAGAIYGQYPPLFNASKPPGEWQSYDIIFETPRWDADDKLTKPGNVTVIHNGVVLHHRKEIIGRVQHRNVAKYSPHPPKGPIVLQDHNNPIRYRNIWVRALGEYDTP